MASVPPTLKRMKTDAHDAQLDEEAEAAGVNLRLIWRDSTLMERAHEADIDGLILQEGRLIKARERRDRALSALKTLLIKQGYERDRVRAHAGEGRTALRDSIVRDARSRLASLLCELRLASADLVATLHTWRLRLAVRDSSRPCGLVGLESASFGGRRVGRGGAASLPETPKSRYRCSE